MYLESCIWRQCTRIQQGDQLGVYVNTSTPSIAYSLSTNPNPPNANVMYSHKAANLSNPTQIGQTMTPDTLIQPYMFFAYAFFVPGGLGCDVMILLCVTSSSKTTFTSYVM